MTQKQDQEVVSLFNSWAGNERGENMAKGHDELVNHIDHIWDFSKVDNLLDLGCGNGRALSIAAGKGVKSLAGIDLSDKMIEEAKKNVPAADLKVGSLYNLPWPDNSFDNIISIEAIYYLEEPQKAFEEIRRVLKPNGRVAILIDFYFENKGSHVWNDCLDMELILWSEEEWIKAMTSSEIDNVKASRKIRENKITEREDFKESEFFPTYELYLDYRKSGALVLSN